MKAKQYFFQLKESKTEDELLNKVSDMLSDLAKDAQNLIEIRHAKSKEAVRSCILEVNNKYKAIVRLYNEDQSDSIIHNYKLHDDGFQAAFVNLNPKYSWAFDLKTHMNKMDELNKQAEEHKKNLENFVPYIVTPYENLTVEELPKEIMGCLYSLGNSVSIGIPKEWLKPLADRITILRYWYSNKQINLQDIEDYEKNPDEWIKNHIGSY